MEPNANFIPSNVAIYVGGRNDTISVYALWKDGHLLVIQTARLTDPDIDYGADYNEQLKLDREYLFGLEKIVSVNYNHFALVWTFIPALSLANSAQHNRFSNKLGIYSFPTWWWLSHSPEGPTFLQDKLSHLGSSSRGKRDQDY